MFDKIAPKPFRFLFGGWHPVRVDSLTLQSAADDVELLEVEASVFIKRTTASSAILTLVPSE